MSARSQWLFAALIAAQAAHSLEEYSSRLYDVLPAARFISSLVSANLPLGFAVVNASLVAFGAWCYFARVRPQHASASAWAWFWALLEGANGTGHLLFALGRGGYYPGAWTAPFLLALAAALATTLLQEPPGSPPSDQ